MKNTMLYVLKVKVLLYKFYYVYMEPPLSWLKVKFISLYSRKKYKKGDIIAIEHIFPAINSEQIDKEFKESGLSIEQEVAFRKGWICALFSLQKIVYHRKGQLNN